MSDVGDVKSFGVNWAVGCASKQCRGCERLSGTKALERQQRAISVIFGKVKLTSNSMPAFEPLTDTS